MTGLDQIVVEAAVFRLLFSGVIAAYCLVGLWAGTSSMHWFLRAAIALGSLALLVPIGAYEPLALFGLTHCVFVLVSMLAWRIWPGEGLYGDPQEPANPSKRTPIRFTLKDVFLAIVVASLASWLVSAPSVSSQHLIIDWRRALLSAILLATITICAGGTLLATRRRWLWGIFWIIAIPLAGVLEYASGDWMHINQFVQAFYDRVYMPSGGVSKVIALEVWFSVSLALILALSIAFFRPAKWRVVRFAARGVALIVGLPILYGYASLYAHMVAMNAPRPMKSAESNALPRLLELSDGIEMMSPARVAEIHAEAIALSKKPGYAVISWHPTEHQTHMDVRHAQSRGMARSLIAEADRLAAAGKHDDAAEYLLAVIRIGQMNCRNGTVTTHETGLALIHMAEASLMKRRRDLSPQKSREISGFLLTLEPNRDPFVDAMKRTDHWMEAVFGWRYRLERAVRPETHMRISGRGIENLNAKVTSFERMLSIDLVSRAFHAHHSRWPDSLHELVPTYLPQVPDDPLSRKHFIYHPAEPEFVLYSVGADGEDDGGKFTNFRRDFYSKRLRFDNDLDIYSRP